MDGAVSLGASFPVLPSPEEPRWAQRGDRWDENEEIFLGLQGPEAKASFVVCLNLWA